MEQLSSSRSRAFTSRDDFRLHDKIEDSWEPHKNNDEKKDKLRLDMDEKNKRVISNVVYHISSRKLSCFSLSFVYGFQLSSTSS